MLKTTLSEIYEHIRFFFSHIFVGYYFPKQEQILFRPYMNHIYMKCYCIYNEICRIVLLLFYTVALFRMDFCIF